MTCALMVPDFSDPGMYPEGQCMEYLNVKRLPNVDRKYRKCEGESLYNLGKANVLVL